MKKSLLVFGVVLLFLFPLVRVTSYAEDQLTKEDLIVKMRFTTGLEPSDSVNDVSIKCAMDALQSAAAYPVCIDTVRIDLTANTEMYDLPADCYKVIMVYLADASGRCLDWTNPWDKGKVPMTTGISTDNLDKVWAIQDDSVKLIGFQPAPTATDSVQLIYEVNVTEITFGTGAYSQRIRIREVYHPALLSACRASLYERFERYDKAKYYWEMFSTQINWAERKLSIPPIDLLLAPRQYTRP